MDRTRALTFSLSRRGFLGLALCATGGLLGACSDPTRRAPTGSVSSIGGTLIAWPAINEWPARFRQAPSDVQEA